jgi:hypothetical protein
MCTWAGFQLSLITGSAAHGLAAQLRDGGSGGGGSMATGGGGAGQSDHHRGRGRQGEVEEDHG